MVGKASILQLQSWVSDGTLVSGETTARRTPNPVMGGRHDRVAKVLLGMHGPCHQAAEPDRFAGATGAKTQSAASPWIIPQIMETK